MQTQSAWKPAGRGCRRPTHLPRAVGSACATMLIAALSCPFAQAAPTVLDFEDILAPATIRTEFSSRGVLFNFAFLSKASLFSGNTVARSGTQVMRVSNPSDGDFSVSPMIITFTSPQSRVRMFAGTEVRPVTGTLQAFDSTGALIGQDGPKTVAADVFTTPFEVAIGQASITRVELLYEDAAFEAIDDLEFEGDPPPPPPPTPPVVTITFPVNGADLDTSRIDIIGTVAGEGLLSPVKLIIDERRPPGSTQPQFSSLVELTGAGNTRQFTVPNFGTLALGPITFTVEAENIGGLKGTGSVSIFNLPAPIRDRFDKEGGATVMGEFNFGFPSSGCRIAVYQTGAISVDGNGNTFLIRREMLDKLRTIGRYLQENFLTSLPFGECPLSEEREVFGARVQDFEGVRIYSHPATGAVFVPAVFTDAIDKRDDVLPLGIPLSDPTSSTGIAQTWLFQQFFRPDNPTLLPSTLEIRGTPPRLWMERQGGDWIVSQLEPSAADRARNKSAATLWESFPCDDLLGPCAVENEPPFPPPNTPDIGELFCNGVTYIPTLEGAPHPLEPVLIPAEWVPVRGDHVATPVFGAVKSAHMVDIDNGLTHETHNGNCPAPEFFLGDLTCASDYEFSVRPIGPQGDTSPLPSLFGKSNTDRIKTEYEVAFASAAHGFLGAPTTGDLVHMTGRWIVDCGHSTYKTELHPIFSFARMKTVVSETNAFTGLEDDLFGGKPATRIAIWVNGWYPGGEGNAIEFDVFPPPRPSPDAVLHVVKPVDFGPGGYRAAEDVNLEFSIEPPGAASHVHLRFTAPFRANTITEAGEMKFESGRQYWGIWYLFWGD